MLSLGIGLAYGDFGLLDIFNIMGDGITSMYDITVISILVAGVVSLVRQNGGIDWILYIIRKCIHGKRGAEVGIAALSSIVDCATANNTVGDRDCGTDCQGNCGGLRYQPQTHCFPAGYLYLDVRE